jgi:hypothetical protein
MRKQDKRPLCLHLFNFTISSSVSNTNSFSKYSPAKKAPTTEKFVQDPYSFQFHKIRTSPTGESGRII